MIREGVAEELLPRNRVGILQDMAQARLDLRPDAGDGIGVEARLVHSEPQEIEGLVRMAAQGFQRAAQAVTVGEEMQLDGPVCQHLLEGGRVVRARPLVEQAGEHCRRAALARRVLGRAAEEGELERHQRHDMLLDQPGLDAARRHHALHAVGGTVGLFGGLRGGARCHGGSSREGRGAEAEISRRARGGR